MRFSQLFDEEISRREDYKAWDNIRFQVKYFNWREVIFIFLL